MILEEIKKEIFNKQCEIENRGYVKGIGYVAITNEMQEDIDFLEKLKKELEKHSKEEQSYKEKYERIRHKVMDRAQKGFNTREERAIWWTVFDFITEEEQPHLNKEVK